MAKFAVMVDCRTLETFEKEGNAREYCNNYNRLNAYMNREARVVEISGLKPFCPYSCAYCNDAYTERCDLSCPHNPDFDEGGEQ